LLGDESHEVQEALISHLDIVLSQFAVTNVEMKTAAYGELVTPICQLCNTTTSWRKQLSLLEQFTNFPQYFTAEQIYDSFLPLLFKYMQQSAAPVKCSAARLLCLFLRRLKYRYQREEIAQRLITEFARGQSYWLRMLFVDICTYILDIFSRIFFKTNFYFIALELAKVRLGGGVGWYDGTG